MSLDRETVRQTALLARIRLDEDRLEKMVGELNGILAWIDQLNEVDTSSVAPLASVTGHALPTRADSVTDGKDAEAVLSNAPDRVDGYFAVPKVVE
ncbi:MAG: Asp-tRNA(Asn)/Glu-tRNA(Gln) amidotransferase subunit GatC [Alphaproteobacteria bacterium]|nr:Asp-tRNA(Asn)/Glu-tRNA(Gln) amidotransferase subunit GatC [Alphaproteobacteria bacterium]